MRVDISDAMGVPHSITTGNLDLLAVWLVETLAEIRPTREIPARIMCFPSFTWDANHPQGLPDWVTISPIISDYGIVRTPSEAVKYLGEQVERAEQWRAERPHERTMPGPCYGDECDHVSHKRSRM